MDIPLLKLIESLEGHDIDKMSRADADRFKAEAMSKFRAGSAELPRLFLPYVADFDRFVWSVEPAEDYCLEWIGRFSLSTIDRIEANLGQPEIVRTVAATSPAAELRVDLLGDFHHAGGLSVFPKLQVALRVNGDPALRAIERLDKVLCEELVSVVQRCKFDLVVRASEDAISERIAPTDLNAALNEVASAARSEADHRKLGEGLELIVDLPAASRPMDQSVCSFFHLMGVFFVHCAFPTEQQ